MYHVACFGHTYFGLEAYRIPYVSYVPYTYENV